MDFDYSPRTKELQARVRQFMDDHVYPNEKRFSDEIEANTRAGKRWTPTLVIEELKKKAQAQGLWNLFFPVDSAEVAGLSGVDMGPGLTNQEYAPLAEIMGRVPWASEVFNCSAPDTGNMETIARYGSTELKQRWLAPLLRGEMR
ncbi:MAG: acyl-CoA dehydrogenase family protein, partial [Betaproteobacteria bacterium]|nr:acyl-CoA dehydrogenase family protein [Betaproteobacteria bacterium]